MKLEWKKLLICIGIPLLVGGLSALLTKENMQLFQQVEKPPLSPPAFLFPVVWTILYVLMGVSLYIVITAKTNERKELALASFTAQLIFNFFWSLIFFNAEEYLFSFIWLVLLWILIALNIYFFSKINTISAKLLIPYLIWVTFAGYLNFGIYLLN